MSGRGELSNVVARARFAGVALVVVPVVLLAAVMIPFDAAVASTPSAAASGPVVKVGMIQALSGPLAGSAAVKDALLASVAAFNKRGGAGTSHAKLQADVCDSRGDANGEVTCARQLVDDGVVATLNDLTFNNPSGVVDIFEKAGIPRIGIGGTDISEFGSKVSFPISAGRHRRVPRHRGRLQAGQPHQDLPRPDGRAHGRDVPGLPHAVVHRDRRRHHL